MRELQTSNLLHSSGPCGEEREGGVGNKKMELYCTGKMEPKSYSTVCVCVHACVPACLPACVRACVRACVCRVTTVQCIVHLAVCVRLCWQLQTHISLGSDKSPGKTIVQTDFTSKTPQFVRGADALASHTQV